MQVSYFISILVVVNYTRKNAQLVDRLEHGWAGQQLNMVKLAAWPAWTVLLTGLFTDAGADLEVSRIN